jgi:hypothetical protein
MEHEYWARYRGRTFGECRSLGSSNSQAKDRVTPNKLKGAFQSIAPPSPDGVPIPSRPRRTQTRAGQIEAARAIQAGIRVLQKTVTKIAVSSLLSPPRVLVGRGLVEVKVVVRTCGGRVMV